MKYRFIINGNLPREVRFAIVSCELNDDHPYVVGKQSIVSWLTDRLTEWGRTDAGRAEWERSSHDFNVGDLSSCCDDPTLVALLERHGCRELDVETIMYDDVEIYWSYDTRIMRDPGDSDV